MRDAQHLLAGNVLRAGAGIANARGIPGTLGCCGLTLDDRRPVFLSSHHVLFGAGAGEQEHVWIDRERSQGLARAARSRHGRCGTVNYQGFEVHVDCATAELDDRLVADSGCRLVEVPCDTSPLAPGSRVTKTGAASGTTEGLVLHTHASEQARIEGRRIQAHGTIVVRSLTPGEPFCADGDSGAVLRRPSGEIVGLLWGVNASGDALACPIAPVLRVLHFNLARLVPVGVS